MFRLSVPFAILVFILSHSQGAFAYTQDTVDTARTSYPGYGTADLPGKVTKYLFGGKPLSLIPTKGLRTAFVLYPKFELLDVMGVLQFISYPNYFNISFVAHKKGLVYSTQGIPTVANLKFNKAIKLPWDVVIVPGGIGTFDIVNRSTAKVIDKDLIRFVQSASAKAKIVFTICSGSAILARTGLLDRRRATTNKFFYDEVVPKFGPKVRWMRTARWVQDGKFITSSGVSAGMDAALYLIRKTYGDIHAYHTLHFAEYWPSFNSSSDPFAAGYLPWYKM